MLVYPDLAQMPEPLRLARRSTMRGIADEMGAFSHADTLCYTLSVSRALCCTAVRLLVREDAWSEDAARVFVLAPAGGDRLWDNFTLTLPMHQLCAESGLFWCRFALDTCYGSVYSHHTDGAYTAPTVGLFPGGEEQLTVYRDDFVTPDWLRGGVMYHVFVDRFRRAGDVPCRADATIEPDWADGIPEYAEERGGRLSNTTFFGGTLWGVAEQMAYIASLGTKCLYLSPVFEARSNHKYDTGDYLRVDAMFGGDEALRTVIERAAAYGIRVILDGVFNHTGDDSRYFNRYGNYPAEGACDSPDSPYYAWYTFSHYPDRYRCWWDIDILPALRSDHPQYRRFICGEVVRKWAEMGIGGWRLDVADELSPVFLEDFRAALKAASPESVVYGEVWEDASNKIAYGERRRYFLGRQLDGVMNYPIREAVIAFVRDGDAPLLRDTMRTLAHHYPPQVLAVQMNLLGTHDTERILNLLAGESGEMYTNAELAHRRLSSGARALGLARLRCAYVTVACLPGLPCIYYGDEAGLEGWRDPFNRLPFPWGREEEPLLAHYRRIGRLRADSSALREGEVHFLRAEAGFILFARTAPDETLLIAVNVGASPYRFSVDLACRNVFSGVVTSAGEMVEVPSLDWLILRAEPNTIEQKTASDLH